MGSECCPGGCLTCTMATLVLHKSGSTAGLATRPDSRVALRSRPSVFTRRATWLTHTQREHVVLAAAQEPAKDAKAGNASAPKADKRSRPFSNTNRFLVPEKCQFNFELEWKEREKNMNLYTGFQGLTISRSGDEYTVCSSWATIADWEDWSSSIHHRRSHLPLGVWQYPPAKGTGFPESFVPLIGLTDKP